MKAARKYDCEPRVEDGKVMVAFEGYGSEHDEELTSLSHLRFSCVPLERKDCRQVVAGTRVTAFKQSDACEIWVDAIVVPRDNVAGGKRSYSFKVQWLDTADRGRTEVLRYKDICLLDPRPLSSQPLYPQLKAALEPLASAPDSTNTVPPPPKVQTRQQRRQEELEAANQQAAKLDADLAACKAQVEKLDAAYEQAMWYTYQLAEQNSGLNAQLLYVMALWTGHRYDCEVRVKDGRALVQYDGFENEEEEELTSLAHLRFSSLPLEDTQCTRLTSGSRVTAFQRSEQCDIWVDAEVVLRHQGGHGAGKCDCRFIVKWLDTADRGSTALLSLEDICLLDAGPLSTHPLYQALTAALGPGAVTGSPGSKGARLLSQQVEQQEQERQQGVPDTPPASPTEAAAVAAAAAAVVPSEERGQQGQRALGPPIWADGGTCMLCNLMTLAPGRGAGDWEEFEGLQLGDVGWVHRRCALWSFNPALRNAALDPRTHVKRVSYQLQEKRKLFCPGHSVLGSVQPVPNKTFYPTTGAQDGRTPFTMGTTRTAKAIIKGRRPLPLQPAQRAQQGGIRRSSRVQGARVHYDDGLAPGEDEGSDYEGEGTRNQVTYQDESEDEDDFIDDSEEGGAGRKGAGKRKRGRRQEDDALRKSERSRKQVKSYDETRAEQELFEEAAREAARQEYKGSGYEEACCQVCGSKARAKEMLLCDGCDHGWHMGCLTLPLTRQPAASWFCPGCITHQACETCGKKAGCKPKKGGVAGGAGAAMLDYCSDCGALCHPGCMQDCLVPGGLQCALCAAGLTGVDAILGCRTTRGQREYYVKFKDASYRRCLWVREVTVARMSYDRLTRFLRDTREAANVEPNVQPQWLQVERVIAMQRPQGGEERCLVKWQGLAYEHATWELRGEVDADAIHQYERRMALRVVRDEAAEVSVRSRPSPQLPAGGPAYLEQQGIGSLKDYQHTGVEWNLFKLHAGLSVILGDEMGLGKTIQTAVFLQHAKEAGLTTGPVVVVVPLSTIGSWERELAKWAPGLEVLAYNGSQEARAIIRKYELGTDEDGLEAARQGLTKLLPRFHVMLTTYEVADKDAVVLRRFGWSGMVIDEGHRLKGENSKLGSQLRSLGAPWRLLLTGTPLQNNLRELFALLAFMADCSVDIIEQHIKAMPDPNPPVPPSLRKRTPAKGTADGSSPSKHGNHAPPPESDPETLEAQAYVRRLHAYLEPRMLRRLKHTTLLGELPAKITRKVACRLSPMQRQLMADLLARNHEAVNAMAKNRAGRKSMNNILMRLRQCCNHPYLFPGQEPESLAPDEAQRLLAAVSGKLSVMQQMLPRLLSAGHRILIFSQSTELLDILEDFLHGFQDTTGLLPAADQRPSASSGKDSQLQQQPPSANDSEGAEGRSDSGEGNEGAVIPFYRLDGSTKLQERQAMIDSFHRGNTKVKVFLMSTRAGSLGINLQSADTIIIYDPDFNPFVDSQAEGRAHRLGQQKTVLVYQMYTAHTVEEKILKLAAKKRRLEEVVTKHLGREKEVSDEDLKSSLFHGWGNLMRGDEEGEGGQEDVSLREADLARLLDRSRVQEGDLVIGADAGSLLGEVKEGNAANMTFDQQDLQDEEEADAVVDRAAEECMLGLLAERARKFQQEKEEAKQALGRGRRGAARVQKYMEDSGDELESDAEASPGHKERRQVVDNSQAARKRPRSDDAEYDPSLSPSLAATWMRRAAQHAAAHPSSGGENAQPNTVVPERPTAQPVLSTDDSDAGSTSSDDSSSDSDSEGRGMKFAGRKPGADIRTLENVPVLQDRKRKAGSASPKGKSGPTTKRAAVAPTVVTAAAAAAPAEDNTWEQVAEETGWTVTDCLAHKITFQKRADAKAKVEPLVQHVKRLRAAGWYLHNQKERLALDNQALSASLEREETARQEDKEGHEGALRQVQQELGAASQRAARQEVELTGYKAQVAQLESTVTSTKETLRAAEQEASRLEGDRDRYKEQVSELQNQTKSMTELYQHAQKYNSQLQEYNTKMQAELQAANESVVRVQGEKADLLGENATLKGRVGILEQQVQAMQTSSSTTEQARHSALEDATRLRAELAAATAERNSLSAETLRLRGELEQCRKEIAQYKEAHGMDASTRTLLEGRARAQADINASLQEQVALLTEQKALADQQVQARTAEVKKLTAKAAQLEADLARAEQRVQEGEILRRKLHNTILELKGNIRVFCRVRPANSSETLEALPGQPIVAFPSTGDLAGCGLELSTVQNGKDLQQYSFGFDKVFCPSATQLEVFDEISQLVQSALDGYKVCIFAYGQTGSGKTHTMLGTPADKGMIPRAMEQVFTAASSLAKQGWRYEMRASMVEVYNEEYKDLLGKGPPAGKKHQVTHDDKGNTSVSYVEAVDVSKPERVQALLDKAMKQRSVGATAMNEHSSRSHMVFILYIDGINEGAGQEVHGVLNLIDLAGSERLSRSAVTGDRLKETQNINKSLSALGDVIAALASKEQHVPYRNSKLTYLLQNSLGGNAKALMFVNVSPAAESAAESLCSLRFAAKVNACEVGTARRNVVAAR
ncbi:hypothetical protein N2152v2_010729 [Parachlorella kessleri]